MTENPDLTLAETIALAPLAIQTDPETWCIAALEIMPLAMLLIHEWGILGNPGLTAEDALRIAHKTGR